MSVGRLIDSMIAPVAPKWALRRARARAEYELLASYAAAEKSERTRDWRARETSADQALIPDMATINSRSRLALRDDGLARSIQSAYRRHVVGIGLHCRSDARDDNGELLESFNTRADLLWREWVHDPRKCDIERRKTFAGIQALIIREWVAVGQCFVRCVVPPMRGTRIPSLALQVFEYEQLAREVTQDPASGREVRGGIEVDEVGAAVAYWFYADGHPLENLRGKPLRIPADDVYHFMDQERVRQTHGLTPNAPVLRKLREKHLYDKYTQLRAKHEACIVGSVESTEDSFFGGGWSGPSTTAPTTGMTPGGSEQTHITFAPGMVNELPPGKRFVMHTPTTPGGQYEPYSRRQSIEVAAGADLDYATVTRDYSEANYGSQRQAAIERSQVTDPLQQLMIDLVLRPIRNEWIAWEILNGRLDAPGYLSGDEESERRYHAHIWQPPPKPWIDPANEAAAAKLLIEQRLATRADILQEQGKDWRQIMDQIDDEQEYAEALGIGLPDAPPERGGLETKASPREPRPRGAAPSPIPQEEER